MNIEMFVEDILITHGLYGTLDSKERKAVLNYVLDKLYDKARKIENLNGYVVLEIDKEVLTKLIIQAPTLLANRRTDLM